MQARRRRWQRKKSTAMLFRSRDQTRFHSKTHFQTCYGHTHTHTYTHKLAHTHIPTLMQVLCRKQAKLQTSDRQTQTHVKHTPKACVESGVDRRERIGKGKRGRGAWATPLWVAWYDKMDIKVNECWVIGALMMHMRMSSAIVREISVHFFVFYELNFKCCPGL